MDRREKLLSGLNLASQAGLEVGPLDRPLVSKSEGAISYIDYADAAFLRDKYRDDTNVTVEKIVEVDAIWGGNTVASAFGGGAAFDYVVASHVVEHVPDLIAWLDELRAVLKPGATLRLAVPDMRFTFDLLRRETHVADVITANVLAARAPLPAQLVDSCLNHHLVDRKAVWDGTAALPRHRTKQSLAHALTCARDTIASGRYIDVHCWVFTPLSFLGLLEHLCALELVQFECERCFDTEREEDEFIVILRRSEDQAACVESWRRAADVLRADHVRRQADEASALAGTLRDAARLFEETARRQSAEIALLQDRFVALERRAAPLAWIARRLVLRWRAAAP